MTIYFPERGDYLFRCEEWTISFPVRVNIFLFEIISTWGGVKIKKKLKITYFSSTRKKVFNKFEIIWEEMIFQELIFPCYLQKNDATQKPPAVRRVHPITVGP